MVVRLIIFTLKICAILFTTVRNERSFAALSGEDHRPLERTMMERKTPRPAEIAFPAVDIIIFNNMSCFHFTQRRRQIDYRFSTILVTC